MSSVHVFQQSNMIRAHSFPSEPSSNLSLQTPLRPEPRTRIVKIIAFTGSRDGAQAGLADETGKILVWKHVILDENTLEPGKYKYGIQSQSEIQL